MAHFRGDGDVTLLTCFSIMNHIWAERYSDIVNEVENNCFLSSSWHDFMGPVLFLIKGIQRSKLS